MRAVSAKILDPTHLELSRPLPAIRDDEERIEVLVAFPDPAEADSPSTGRRVKGRRLRDLEDAWCRAHPEVFDRYQGQWVVVEGEKLVAHGREPARLVEEARARGIRSPYVFYVETPEPGVVKLGL